MAKRKVCISFDYEHDRHYKNLLSAWDSNSNFEFRMSDKTPNEINSNDYSRVKAVLTQKIKNSSYLLVVVGKYANTRHPRFREIGYKNWITWEIEKAKENNLKIVAVKIDRSYNTPDALYGCGASWAMSFNQSSIIKALNEAR